MISIVLVQGVGDEQEQVAWFEATDVPAIGDVVVIQTAPGDPAYVRWKVRHREWEANSCTGKPIAEDTRAKLRTVWLDVVQDGDAQ